MKAKTLKKLIKDTKSKDPKVILTTLLSNDKVSHTDIPAINSIMQGMGIIANPAKVMGDIRKELTPKILKGLGTWENVTELVTTLRGKHDLDESKILSTVRKAVARQEGLTMPRKPSLGKTKQAVVDYVTTDKAPTPAGLKAYLMDKIIFDEDDKKNSDKAQHVVSMNFTFAMAILNGCK